MRIENVFEYCGRGAPFTLIESCPKSVTAPTNDVAPFFVKPTIIERHTTRNCKVVLFSAPGATGKSSLANYIARELCGVLWDLSKEHLGNHSLSGMLINSLGADSFSSFTQGLKSGTATLVIDAFDEAEMISGHSAVETLLDDISGFVSSAEKATVFLFARTETAHFIYHYLMENKKITVSHYEISFFAEEESVEFIKGKLEFSDKRITPAVDTCIREQFSIIRRLLVEERAIKSFLGYAPVLETLAASFDDTNNTMAYIIKLDDTSTGTDIILQILEKILLREQKKVISGFRERVLSFASDFSDWDALFSTKAQIHYLASMVVFGESDVDGYCEKDLPSELIDDYHNTINAFLPEHPFLLHRSGESGEVNLDFAGPAFRDYVLAELMMDSTYEDYAISYFSDHRASSRFPSQMFFDFYLSKSENTIMGHHFPFIYEAFKSKEKIETTSTISLFESDDGIDGFFQMKSPKHDKDIEEYPITITNTQRGLCIFQANNIHVDVECDVHLGNHNEESRIVNSTIICKKLFFDSSSIRIEAYDPGDVLIASSEDIDSSGSSVVRFEIRPFDADVRLSAPNIGTYPRLLKYRYDYADNSDIDATKFAHAVKNILHRFRKHGKDAPGKHREMIDNIIVGSNKFKGSILEFLKKSGIVYHDTKDPDQYKLEVTKLGEYGLSWSSFFELNSSQFELLMRRYKEWHSTL